MTRVSHVCFHVGNLLINLSAIISNLAVVASRRTENVSMIPEMTREGKQIGPHLSRILDLIFVSGKK